MYRRSFIQFGAIAAAGCLPLLRDGQARGASLTEPSVKHIITIMLAGGLSQLESFDPKPDAPAVVRGEFGTIQTAIPGVSFSEHLPELARSARDLAVLRGVSHQIGIHDAGEKYLLTGVKAFRPDTPSLGAITSRWTEARTEVPVYAAIPSLSPNAGELGQLHEPFNLLGDSGRLLQLGPDLDDPLQIREFERRITLLNTINFGNPELKSEKSLAGRTHAYESAHRTLLARRLRTLTDLQQEPVAVRAAYGQGEEGDYLLFARRLVEAGVRYVNVRLAGWDTHSDNFQELKSLLPPLDKALSSLISDLKDRGLLSSTLIALVTEFGRTPSINSMQGRDHWPSAYSVLLAGGRVRGGQVLGETDAQAANVVDGRCSPEDLAVTLLQEIGIVPNETFVPPTGRVLLSEGRFLHELF